MSVYGASATRDRQAWLFGLTGPQFFMVLAAGFPTWMAIAIGQWVTLLVLVPLSGFVLIGTGDDGWLPLHVGAHIAFFVALAAHLSTNLRPAILRRMV